jgi:hypothetical protein
MASLGTPTLRLRIAILIYHYHLIREALTDVILFLLSILYCYVRITWGRYLPRIISTIQVGWWQLIARSTAQRHLFGGTGIATQNLDSGFVNLSQGLQPLEHEKTPYRHLVVQ